MKLKTKYGLIVLSLLMILVLVGSVRFIPMTNASKVSTNQAHPVKGKVVKVTENTVKIIINGHEYTLIMRSGAYTKQPKKEFFIVRAGDVSKEVHNARSVQVYTVSKPSSSKLNKITVIEPDVLRVNIPISGALQAGYYDEYGTYTSTVAIDVSVQWTPGSETLGIAILDTNTGTGYGYWYTGGSANTSFGTTLGHSYYVLIINYAGNSQPIYYNGTITLYIY